MQRRQFILTLGGIALLPLATSRLFATGEDNPMPVEKLLLTDAQWRARLTPEQYEVLRKEGTERPGSSLLLEEKRVGTFVCVACDHPLFSSASKYDSGTGWPSFYDFLPGGVETRLDFKLIWPRTEYHCAKCGGHHGHVFEDGPKPTGLRYCNNGVALKFIPT
jgi:peptide-methionine (R)-S-oxide reductase